MNPTIAELRKFYQAAGKDGHVVVHEGKDGSQAWIERFLSNVNKEANEAEGTIVHLISTPRIDPVYDVMDPFGVDDRALQKNRAVFYNHRWMGPQDLPIGKKKWLLGTRGSEVYSLLPGRWRSGLRTSSHDARQPVAHHEDQGV